MVMKMKREDKWEGEYRGIGYEISAENRVSKPFLKILFYEGDNPSFDIIHHGYCHTLEQAHRVARQIINEELGDKK